MVRHTWPVRSAAAACCAVLAGTVLTACGGGSPARPVAERYLSAWSRGDVAAAAASTDDSHAAATALKQLRTTLLVTHVTTHLRDVSTKGTKGTATFTATLQLQGLGNWRYRGQLQLLRSQQHWLVHWGASDIHPQLRAGEHLGLDRTLPPRAPILDAGGQPLFAPTPVVVVGVEPDRLRAAAATLATVAAATGIDAAKAAAAIKHAPPTSFVSLITLRRSDYDRIRAQIHDLPGVVFQTKTLDLAPTRAFARALLGVVGPATADALRNAGPSFVASDDVGLSGLQALYQRRLAGTPSGAVEIVTSSGAVRAKLATFTGHAGQPVRITLDRGLQNAADDALAAVQQPAALVAVRPSTGAILAVANRPVESSFDTALVGELPPGSSFKVVTSYGLLTSGHVTPTTPVPCPPQVVVHGKVFKNFEHESAGTVPFRTDFAMSCNTAFVGLARRVDDTALRQAAAAFGIGGHWRLPVSVFTGTVPPTDDPVEHAADVIGQGKVLVSPLAMALVAGAVDAGTWREPTLVLDPAQSSSTPPQALQPSAVAALRELMRAVVTSGTGTAANLPGEPVAGKTGTAEFGSGNPPKTHAWFIAYRGDLAVAVVVEGGGVGGAVAAPIAAAFLRAAAASG